MKRRTFLLRGSLIASGQLLLKTIPVLAAIQPEESSSLPQNDLYTLFKEPTPVYRPFVRWWWNGDKVEKTELARELRLMRDAGIGGVEINPIRFPSQTDDMGKPSIPWLSPEWIDLLDFTLTEAASLGLTCDLLVGSGWPFGAEYLEGEERSQVVVVATRHLEGGQDYAFSTFDLFKEGDPAVSDPSPYRTRELLSVKLVPDPFISMDQMKDLSDQISTGVIQMTIPRGNHVLYGLVKVGGFSKVINGAPGASGPVLNHFNEAAVNKYLHHMTDAIQKQIGPLAGRVRAFFTDSMELEGANWCADMPDEFKKRRGYDLMPYLPFLLYKIGWLGNVYDFYPRNDNVIPEQSEQPGQEATGEKEPAAAEKEVEARKDAAAKKQAEAEQDELDRVLKNFNYPYGAELGPGLKEEIERVRYDFEVTKSDLIKERFIHSFTQWCKDNKVLSRVQAYGKGYYPLEGSFDIDLPECETWVKYGIGEEMSEIDPRIGRAYTMINKFVSSAAHLKGKRHISCEECTNTDVVFNATLEMLKVAGDQSAISGVTHPVFHGFNYSPPDAPFPGWIRYGTFFNERNTWWPFFRRFTDYKCRMSALLQHADMFADIAILSPVPDMWSLYGAQNEPFPSLSYPAYMSLVWESIHQNGNGCDYISESVIRESVMKGGTLQYGPRQYHTIFMVRVERMEPETAAKLFDFVSSGGRIFCIETYPHMSPGWNDYQRRDGAVRDWMTRMKIYPDRFIQVQKPEKNFMQWYRDLQRQYAIEPYVRIDQPNPYVTQVRYRGDGMEFLLVVNSSRKDGHVVNLAVAEDITTNRQAWIWDAETGERWRVETGPGAITLDLSPADAKLIVFDKTKRGRGWRPMPTGALAAGPLAGGVPVQAESVTGPWKLELRHMDGSVKTASMDELKDLKDNTEFVHFAGTAIYTANIEVADPKKLHYVNLGRVAGVSELAVNGQAAGTAWFGRRIFPVTGLLHAGTNSIEVRVTTVMGNYMKSLKDNDVAQKWTNEKRQNQPIQSLGLLGPVTIYQ